MFMSHGRLEPVVSQSSALITAPYWHSLISWMNLGTLWSWMDGKSTFQLSLPNNQCINRHAAYDWNDIKYPLLLHYVKMYALLLALNLWLFSIVDCLNIVFVRDFKKLCVFMLIFIPLLCFFLMLLHFNVKSPSYSFTSNVTCSRLLIILVPLVFHLFQLGNILLRCNGNINFQMVLPYFYISVFCFLITYSKHGICFFIAVAH